MANQSHIRYDKYTHKEKDLIFKRRNTCEILEKLRGNRAMSMTLMKREKQQNQELDTHTHPKK